MACEIIFEFGQIDPENTVLIANSVTTEEENPAGSSAATAFAAVVHANNRGVCEVTNNGPDDAWITFGASPTAAAGTTHFLPADRARSFVIQKGDKGAALNV